MRNKVLYRTTNLWNILLFIVISFIFFLIQQSAYLAVSILDKNFITQSLSSYPLIVILYISLVYTSYNLLKVAKYLFVLLFVVQTGIIIFNLFQDFSKLIIVTTGVQIIFSYYFYNFLILELESAVYNTTIHPSSLFENSWQRVEVFNENKKIGYLTNWDENGFNVHFYDKDLAEDFTRLTIKFETKVLEVNIKASWQDREKKNMGFFVIEQDNSSHGFNWNDLYCTLLDMGFEIGYIR